MHAEFVNDTFQRIAAAEGGAGLRKAAELPARSGEAGILLREEEILLAAEWRGGQPRWGLLFLQPLLH
jgi:hypothetical protein